MSENRSILVAASLFVLCAICGALYLSRSSATSAPLPIVQVSVSTPSRDRQPVDKYHRRDY